MREKQREIMKTDGNEKEKDCAVARVNTFRVGAQAEQNFFKQEMGVDMTHASQVFLAEQISFHRKVAERLEGLYHECWPSQAATEDTPAAADTTAATTNEVLNPWDSTDIYEEV
eukprot:TRINITY_DN30112_c0_g1_i1.p2 TRINITY_DN30112_c0_g1~~TRINITY_DN30112_c0_g1_i1.p2  ORF type:complete len:114 (-),score=36.31 TRINITY_DN30112_c0_g1_i1:163-504(-)